MAVLQRVALYPSERLDIPDARALDAMALNDWRFFLSGVIADKSYVISGFEVSNYSNIFLVPGFKLKLSTVSLLHVEATTQAAGFYVANGQEPDVSVTLSANATNYVEADLITVTGTPDLRAFWDPGANGGEGGEYTDTVDTVIDLELSVTSNVSGFTAGKIPLYKVTTNSSGVVTNLEYCINNFFRLGTGGNNPDPDATYQWPNLPDASKARAEGANSTTTATVNNAPFQGGDKNIPNWKAWMDAIMTVIWETHGRPKWYSAPVGSGSSLINALQNSNLLALIGGALKQLGSTHQVQGVGVNSLQIPTNLPIADFNPGGGTFYHEPSATTYTYTSYNGTTGAVLGVTPNPVGFITIGDVISYGSIGHLALTDGTTLFRLGRQYNQSVSAFADIDMTGVDSRVLYLILPSTDSAVLYGFGDNGTTPVKPKTVSAVSSVDITVALGGNYKTTGGTILVRGTEFTYTSYVAGTGLFLGVSPDPSGIVTAGDHVYQAPGSGVGTLHLSAREDVPGQTGIVSEGAERVLWLGIYDGVGTIRTRDGAIKPGEVIDIGNNDTLNMIQYIGSTGPADNFPVYDVNSITNGTNLTKAIKTAYEIIETPIYDESVDVPEVELEVYWPIPYPNDGLSIDSSLKEVAQGFTALSNGDITSIVTKFRKIGSPDCYMIAEIQSDSSGLPSGVVLAVSNVIQTANLTGTFSDVQFYFNIPASISVGNTYHIVVKVYGSPTLLGVSDYLISGVGLTNPYAGGQSSSSADGGSSFTPNTWDLYFQILDETGYVSGTNIVLPLNSKTSSPQTYTIAADALLVHVNGVLFEPDVDYIEPNTSSITLLRDVPAGSRIRLRVGNVGGATNASSSLSLQGSYANGNSITTVTGFPVIINGPVGEKLLSVFGDMYISGVIDPKGITFTPESTNPLPAGQSGFWLKDNGISTELMFKKDDDTHIDIQNVIEQVGGNSQNFSRSMLNSSGITIPAGKAVYIAAPGQIGLADATGSITSVFFGITTESIPNGQIGNVVYAGIVPNVLQAPLTGHIWLDTIAGELTVNPPQNPGDYQVTVGIADGLDLILQPQVFGLVVS